MTARGRIMQNGDRASNVMEQCGSAFRLFLDRGQVKPIVLDLADFITSGDTITLAEKIRGDLITSTPTVSGSTVTLNATGPAGSAFADIRATLSTGETITQRVMAQENNYHDNASDYLH